MYRTLQYALLFLVAALLQIFLFNNLTLSVYLNPLVYVVFIALLPMETAPIKVLLAGLVMGLTMDWTMGAAGVNTIATVFIAFVRIHLLVFVCGKENVHDGGVPSVRRLGEKSFAAYLALTVLLHNAIFFYLEALSWVARPADAAAARGQRRGRVSFCWLIAQVFTSRLSPRL